MTSLSIEVVEDVSAQESLAEEWDAAVPAAFTRTLSQSGWYFAWKDAFAARRSVIITARECARLVGVLPLLELRTDVRGLYFPQITTFTGADYQVPVVAVGASPCVLPRMVDAAIEHFGTRYVYWWANIPICDSSAAILGHHLRARGMRVTEQYRVAPRLDIAGRTYSEIEATWPASHRTDVRRQRKRLGAKGDVVLWEPSDRKLAQQLLEEFFVVHDEKWLAQGQPGRFQSNRQRKHFQAIVDRLWGRGLHFSALRCGDINDSFGLGFTSDGWIQWDRPTYRREYHNLSPGKVHIALLLEEVCRRGWRGIDFLQGEEAYKLQWSNQQVRTVDYYSSVRSWSPAYLWFTRGKPYVRERLGPLYMGAKMRLHIASRRVRRQTFQNFKS